MDKTLLKPEDTVALRDPKCSNNVFKGIITCISPGKNGIWVAVNYRYGLLPSICEKNKDKWILLRTNGNAIVGHWDDYKSVREKQIRNRKEALELTNKLQQRVTKAIEKLNDLDINARPSFGSVLIKVEDVETLLEKINSNA